MLTESEVRRIALQLPGAYEQRSYGDRPSWRTAPRIFAWIREGPRALVVWVDSPGTKEALLASGPDMFFTTPHYDGYPVVLIDMETIDVARGAEMIQGSWALRAPRSITAQWRRDHDVGPG